MTVHPSAIIIFAAIVLSSLVITYWAHRRSKSAAGFYAAGGNITREAGPVKGGNTLIAFVTDPDGYKIELIQRDA